MDTLLICPAYYFFLTVGVSFKFKYFRLALFAANFIQTRLSTIQVLLKCSISCLLLLWLLIFLISLVVFGFIVCARYISGVDSVDYQGSFFLDKVNTFEAVVYNSCCVQQQTEPFTDSEDYYYYFDSVDYRMPQEILQCPQDPIYLAALCDRLPSSNQLPCTCYNDLELYTSISDSFYSDNCILLTTLADSIFVKEDYSDAEICGLDNDSGFYSPNLFQQTFANMLSQAVLPFAVAVCISALLFFILSCLGCVLLKARDKSLSNQRKRITRRKKFRF